MSAQPRLEFTQPIEVSTVTLRDYQTEAVEAVLAAPDQGIQRPLIAMPTGGGKTICFAEIIRRRPGRALVLAHRDELITQAVDKIHMVIPGADIGVVKAARHEADRSIVVASVQSLNAKRLERMGEYSTVIVDEAHHVRASGYERALSALGSFEDGGPLTVGVTATPERGDRLALGTVFQKVVFRRSLVWMIAKGYLSDIRAIQIHLKADFDKLKVRQGDYVDSEVAELLHDAQAPQMAVKGYQEHAAGRRAIVFTPTVALAYEMAEAFRAAGIPAEGIDGTTATEERRAILSRLRTGETLVVANAALLVEGFDEPAVDCIIGAKPTRSKSAYLQMIGRGLRLFPGKTDCLVLDLVGSTTRHDLVTTASLLGKKTRLETGKSLLAGIRTAEAAGQEVTDELGELVAVRVELFRKLTWVPLPGGRWTLPLPDGRITLLPQGEGWRVEREDKAGRRGVIAEGVSLEWAQGIAEDLVRSEGAEWLTDPERPWRRKPASDKQAAILRRKGLWTPGMSAGEASDAITRLFAGGRR
jgi:ATP-dependent helicase IRC3